MYTGACAYEMQCEPVALPASKLLMSFMSPTWTVCLQSPLEIRIDSIILHCLFSCYSR